MRGWVARSRSTTLASHRIQRRALGALSVVALAIACREAIVEPVAVATVTVSGPESGLRLGQSGQLTVALKSTEGWTLPNQGVTWATGDASIATVTPSGQVTAVKRGTVTVTASAGGTSGTASVTVIGVSGVAIAPDTLAVVVAEQQAVTAAVTADPGVSVPPSWVARDTSVAQVDATGRVSARKLGVTWVVASAEAASDSVKVRVVPVPVTPPASGAAAPVTTSVLSGAVSLTIPPGATTAPTLTVAPVPTAPADDRIPAGGAYVFGPDGAQFATPITVSLRYDPAQIPAAKRKLLRLHLVEGSTVTEVPGSTVDSASGRVSAPVSHFSTYAILVPADPSQVAVSAGAGQSTFVNYELPAQPAVLVRDAQGRPVARAKVSFDVTGGGGSLRSGATTSSDTALTGTDGVATLGAKWKLGQTAGTNTLTVKVFTAAGAVAVTTPLTATAQANPVARVVVAPDAETLIEGATRLLTATLYDARDSVLINRYVMWASTDTSIASVSTTGLTFANSVGITDIIAASEGKSGWARIVVAYQSPAVASVNISPSTLSLVAGSSQQLVVTVKDSAGQALTNRVVRWSTSDSTIATITASGVVTGRMAGTAQLTARSGGKSAVVNVTIQREYTADTVRAVYYEDQGAFPVFLRATGGGTPDSVRYTLITDSVPRPGMTGGLVNPQPLKFSNGIAPITTALWGTGRFRVKFQIFDGLNLTERTSPAVLVFAANHCMGLANPIVSGIPDSVRSGQIVRTANEAYIDVGSCRGDPNLYRYVVRASLVDIPSAGTATLSGTTTTTETHFNTFSDLRINVSQPMTLRLRFDLVGCPDAFWCSPVSQGLSRLSKSFVVVPQPVASVEMNTSTATVGLGGNYQLLATTKDAAGTTLPNRTIVWSSSDTTVATVTPAGLVSGKAVGTALIRATSEGKVGEATISVAVPQIKTGVLSASETWSGLVNMTGSVRVPAGLELTILPGTRVLVDEGLGIQLLVEGRLVAVGTSSNKVVIQGSSEGKAASRWEGIKFRNTRVSRADSTGWVTGSKLVNVSISNAVTAVYVYDQGIYIDSGAFANNGNGIELRKTDGVYIANSQFSSNTYGIFTEYETFSGDITGPLANTWVYDSRFVDNGTGILIGPNQRSVTNFNFRRNRFEKNNSGLLFGQGGYGINGGSGSILTNDFVENGTALSLDHYAGGAGWALTVANNTFARSYRAVVLEGVRGNTDIKDNFFYRNRQTIVTTSQNESFTIRNNSFVRDSVVFDFADQYAPSPDISANLIDSTFSAILDLRGGFNTFTFTNNVIVNTREAPVSNYWFRNRSTKALTFSSNYIEWGNLGQSSRVFDGNDDFNVGVISFAAPLSNSASSTTTRSSSQYAEYLLRIGPLSP
jgi:Bacterial Ig-like domain (group 2)/Right handed beta helix region